jgi:hypothetical protein
MDASAAEIDQSVRSLLGPRYARVSVPLVGSVALDDFSTAAYATMNQSLEAYFASPAYAATRAWLARNLPADVAR